MDRPIPVIIISAVTVFTGLFVLVMIGTNTFFYELDKDTVFFVAVFWLIAEAVLYLICGAFIFAGHNWARLTFMAWVFFGLGYKFLYDPFSMGYVLSISTWMLILLLSTICLFGDDANDYYA